MAAILNNPPPLLTRTRLGWISAILLCVAVVLQFFDDGQQMQTAQWRAGTIRVGLMTGAIWMAWPDLQRLPPKIWLLTLGGLLCMAILMFRFPLRYALPVLGVGLLLLLLRPRKR